MHKTILNLFKPSLFTSVGFSPRKRNGFTLLELILVILFISVIVGASSPIFRKTLLNLKLKSTIHNISQCINYAQEMAIIDKTVYRINFDEDRSSFWLTKYEQTDGQASFNKIGSRLGKVFNLSGSISINAEKDFFSFYPDGRSDQAEIQIIDKRIKTAYLIKLTGFGENIEVEEIEQFI